MHMHKGRSQFVFRVFTYTNENQGLLPFTQNKAVKFS